MKIMRPNYDKAWRCPDWSGPALKGGKGDCPGGSTASMWGSDYDLWKVFVCRSCGTIILPSHIRKLDPTWWKYKLERKIEDWKYERSLRD